MIGDGTQFLGAHAFHFNTSPFDVLAASGYKWLLAGFGNGVSEPVFVEKNVSSKEGEGWLLATVYDSKASTSSMVILDAQAVNDGPVAVAKLDHRIPFGFHGSWRNN